MKTSTAVPLILLGAAGASLGLYLTRGRGTGARTAAGVAGFLTPWAAYAAVGNPTTCTFGVLFDTHGAASRNQALAERIAQEQGIDVWLHAGDVADNASLYGPWWDDVILPAIGGVPVVAAQGNHDTVGASAFERRFGHLPMAFTCGDAEVFVLPWSLSQATADWLLDAVSSSASRWKILLLHHPVWSASRTDNRTRQERLAPALEYIDLVLAGHDHVFWDSVHVLDSGHRVRQVIDISGPKKYRCRSDREGCVEDSTGYIRVEVGPGEMTIIRQEV